MSHDFESLFQHMADRAMGKAMRVPKLKPVKPPRSLEVQRRARLAYLAEWHTTRECAEAWKVNNPVAWYWLTRQHGLQAIESRRRRMSETRWFETQWRAL